MVAIIPIPAFTDNYIWLLRDGRGAVVVDPGDAAPVLAYLAAHDLALTAILATHHHGDHVGGVAALLERFAVPVFGPARERIPEPFKPLHGGQGMTMLGIDWQVIDVPGHTAGHIAYYAPDVDGTPLLFCGDTLFSGGCGRLFEGTPAQMLASLDALAALPAATRVCCAHEYTLANLRFAAAVEPGNQALADYTRQCERRRAQGLPTLPSDIGTERAINPFLRSRQPAVAQAVRAHTPSAQDEVAVFAALREWKNTFR